MIGNKGLFPKFNTSSINGDMGCDADIQQAHTDGFFFHIHSHSGHHSCHGQSSGSEQSLAHDGVGPHEDGAGDDTEEHGEDAGQPSPGTNSTQQSEVLKCNKILTLKYIVIPEVMSTCC